MTKQQNLILMYGEDSFSLVQELDKWKKLFAEKYDGDLNIEEFADNPDLNSVKSSIQSAPFLSEKRMIIMKNFLSGSKSEAQAELKDSLESVPESTVMIFAEINPPDKRMSLFKFLSTNANVYLYAKPKGVQLSNWLVKRVLFHEGQIDQMSANYLISILGDNLWALENETQKLCLYAQGKIINKEMIDELVNGNVEKSVFTMTDQMARKDHAGVLKSLRELQKQGEEPAFIFSMIARQFRIMLEIKSLAEARMGESSIASKMAVHPFVVMNTIRQCKNFTYGQLKSGLEKLLEIDRRLKSGNIHLSPKSPDQYMVALEKILIEN